MSDVNLLENPSEEPTKAKPEGLPEKFWNAETGEIRVDALLQSYLELEKKLSGSLPMPDNDDNKARVLKAIGVPDTAENYSVEIKGGLFDPDPEVNQRLHAKGFTQDQLQEVYDLAAERLVPTILDLAAEFQADREMQRLIEAFGGPEKWVEVSRQLLAFGRKNLSTEVLQGLSASYEGVMALYNMMKGGEDKMQVAGETLLPTEEKDLQQMMRDPKYWRDRDPAFISKVTEGFRKLYSE